MIELAVSMPPSVNNLFFNVKGRGRVKTGRYKHWLESNLWLMKTMRLEQFTGPVAAEYILPDKSRLDIDNACKPLGDLLEKAGVLSNDKQIRELWVRHIERPDVLIRVRNLA